jgi:hypothetical protein
MEAVRGRVIARRAFGKLAFYSIQDETGTTQVYARLHFVPQFVTARPMFDSPMPYSPCEHANASNGHRRTFCSSDWVQLGPAVLSRRAA